MTSIYRIASARSEDIAVELSYAESVGGAVCLFGASGD